MASRRRRRKSRRAARITRRALNPEEARLLTLARDVVAIGSKHPSPGAALDAALRRLADPTAGPMPPGANKSRALALGWAREQARLALEDIIVRAVSAGAVRDDVPPDTLAWLLLTAAEALQHEPVEIALERLDALWRLTAARRRG